MFLYKKQINIDVLFLIYEVMNFKYRRKNSYHANSWIFVSCKKLVNFDVFLSDILLGDRFQTWKHSYHVRDLYGCRYSLRGMGVLL